MSVLPDPSKRSTIDLVVLGLTITVCAVIIISIIGIVIVEAVHPSVDTQEDVRQVGELVSVVVGAIVGFIGGRSVGRAEEKDRRDDEQR